MNSFLIIPVASEETRGGDLDYYDIDRKIQYYSFSNGDEVRITQELETEETPEILCRDSNEKIISPPQEESRPCCFYLNIRKLEEDYGVDGKDELFMVAQIFFTRWIRNMAQKVIKLDNESTTSCYSSR